jgi:hypothetical protein
MVDLFVLLLHVRLVSGSDLGSQTADPELHFRDRLMPLIISRLLQYYFQFFIYKSSLMKPVIRGIFQYNL